MILRWRILRSHFDPEAYERILADYRKQPPPGYSALDPYGPSLEDLARGAAPAKVEPEDGAGSLSEVRGMVAGGRLKLTDLVDTGRGWVTVEQCPELAAESEPIADREQSQQRLMTAVAIAVVLSVVVFAFLRALAGR